MSQKQTKAELRAARKKNMEAHAKFVQESREALDLLATSEDIDGNDIEAAKALVQQKSKALVESLAAASGLDAEKVQKLKGDIVSGKKFDPRTLHQLMMFGTQDERLLVRELLHNPEVQARNQDLILPHVKMALEGRKSDRQFIERHRIVMPETLPDWVKVAWEEDSNARWRQIDLFDPRVKGFLKRKFGSGAIIPEFRWKLLPPYRVEASIVSEESFELIPDEFVRDIRGALYTLKAVDSLAFSYPSTSLGGEDLWNYMKEEVENDFINFTSPSIVGKLYREKALHEMRAMFSAMLIEDAIVAFDLPADDELKLEVWDEIRFQPWLLSSHNLVVTGPKLARQCRDRYLEEEELIRGFSDILLDPESIKEVKREMFSSKRAVRSADAIKPDKTSARAPDSFVGRNRRLEILAAIESFLEPSDSSERYARILSKFVGADDHLQIQVMKSIEDGVNLDEIVLKLRENRPAREVPKSIAPTAATVALPNPLLFVDDIDEPQLRFEFTVEALEGMKDGNVRHCVHNQLDKFAHMPALVDRKKIKEIDQVWELRIFSVAARVYFLSEREGLVKVILVGKKKDQVLDIRRLKAIRDREMSITSV